MNFYCRGDYNRGTRGGVGRSGFGSRWGLTPAPSTFASLSSIIEPAATKKVKLYGRPILFHGITVFFLGKVPGNARAHL